MSEIDFDSYEPEIDAEAGFESAEGFSNVETASEFENISDAEFQDIYERTQIEAEQVESALQEKPETRSQVDFAAEGEYQNGKIMVTGQELKGVDDDVKVMLSEMFEQGYEGLAYNTVQEFGNELYNTDFIIEGSTLRIEYSLIKNEEKELTVTEEYDDDYDEPILNEVTNNIESTESITIETEDLENSDGVAVFTETENETDSSWIDWFDTTESEEVTVLENETQGGIFEFSSENNSTFEKELTQPSSESVIDFSNLFWTKVVESPSPQKVDFEETNAPVIQEQKIAKPIFAFEGILEYEATRVEKIEDDNEITDTDKTELYTVDIVEENNESTQTEKSKESIKDSEDKKELITVEEKNKIDRKEIKSETEVKENISIESITQKDKKVEEISTTIEKPAISIKEGKVDIVDSKTLLTEKDSDIDRSERPNTVEETPSTQKIEVEQTLESPISIRENITKAENSNLSEVIEDVKVEITETKTLSVDSSEVLESNSISELTSEAGENIKAAESQSIKQELPTLEPIQLETTSEPISIKIESTKMEDAINLEISNTISDISLELQVAPIQNEALVTERDSNNFETTATEAIQEFEQGNTLETTKENIIETTQDITVEAGENNEPVSQIESVINEPQVIELRQNEPIILKSSELSSKIVETTRPVQLKAERINESKVENKVQRQKQIKEIINPIRLVKRLEPKLNSTEKNKKSAEISKNQKSAEIYEFKRQIKKVVISGPRLERTGGISLRSRVSSISSFQRDQLEQNNRISRIPQNRVRRKLPTQTAIRMAQVA